MKSELIESKSVSRAEFPIMCKAISGGFTVLFTEPTVGVIANDPRKVWGIGRYSDTWTTCMSTASWERLPAGTQIVLTQE